nr:MAG TPA: CHC2 zinc finger protein [Caudoviricetes sp.]
MTGLFCYLVGLSLFFEDILGAANWGGGGGDFHPQLWYNMENRKARL